MVVEVSSAFICETNFVWVGVVFTEVVFVLVAVSTATPAS